MESLTDQAEPMAPVEPQPKQVWEPPTLTEVDYDATASGGGFNRNDGLGYSGAVGT